MEVAREQCSTVEGHNTKLRQSLEQMKEKVQQSKTLVREAKQKLLAQQEEKASLMEEVAKLKDNCLLSNTVHSREVQELGQQVQELRLKVKVLEEIKNEDFSHKEKWQEEKASLVEEVAKLKEECVLSNTVHSREVQKLENQVQELRQQVEVLEEIKSQDCSHRKKQQEVKASLEVEVAKLKYEGVLSSSVYSGEVQELGQYVQELRQQVQVLEEITSKDFLQKEKLKAIVEVITEHKKVLQTKVANSAMHVTRLKEELESSRKLPAKQKASKFGLSASKKKMKLVESSEKLHIPVKCFVNQLSSNHMAMEEEIKLHQQIEKTTVSKEGGIGKNQSRNLGRMRILYQDRWVSLSTIMEEERVDLGLKLEPHLIRVSEVVQEPIGDREAGAKKASWHKSLARVGDEKEREDLQHQDWKEMKEASSDRARKDLAWRTFQNPVYSDPAKNLSFHGFKGRGCGLPTRIRRSEISEGRLIPLSGGKRKKHDSLGDPERSKVIRMTDFGRVMRSKFAEIFTAKANISQEGIEDFTTFLKHHREGQEETASFLTFYAGRKAAHITEQQAWEVLGMEEWFSKILQVCGKVEAVRCRTCKKNHKFSL